MKYIHYTCLKHWINNKCYAQIEKNDDCAIYMIKPVECELCKTKLPDFICKKGILFQLLELKPDFKNYLIFESLTLDKNQNRFNYVVSLDQNKKICVGRGHDSNVVFSDISVSRTHCIFTLEGKNVFIQDNDSTFGTLVLIQSPKIKLVENLPLYIQIGRTFFKCNIQVSNFFFGCCGISEKPNDNFYFQQNEKDIVYKRNYTILSLDKSREKDDNNNSNEFKNNEEGVLNIKTINIKNQINLNGNDSNSKIKNNENFEEDIFEDKGKIHNKNEYKKKEDN
jgi:pSer/pThr/pTyr-binding forkhead associated (FHA) protein